MSHDKTKTTTPISSVGADDGQSLNQKTNQSITEDSLGERKALLMRSVKSAFALLLTKVTKPRLTPDKVKGELFEKNH